MDPTVKQSANTYSYDNENRLEGLIDRLPKGIRRATRWLRRPSSRWIRIPASLLLVGGGLLGFLPFLGFWMLPLGLALLAEDLPPMRRARDRILDQIERRRPRWFAPKTLATPGVPPSHRQRSTREPGET
jgi:hypothetical protein